MVKKYIYTFSIIIPTYNRCELIKQSIVALKAQSYLNWECIIINDGSTDDTEIIIPEIIKNDNRFKLINQPNFERAISRNNGAKLAKGEYFIFLDSDDYFKPSHLQDISNFIKQDIEKSKMYFTNGKFINNNTEEIIFKDKIPYILPIDFFLENSVVPARVCLHNSIFNYFSFDPRTIIVEDTVLWTEIIEFNAIKYIPIDSVIYQLHEDNSVNIEKHNAYLQRLNGLNVLFYKKNVGKKIPNSIKRKHLNRCYYGISDYYSHQNKKIISLYWILKSIITYPELDLKHKFVRLLFLLKFAQSKP